MKQVPHLPQEDPADFRRLAFVLEYNEPDLIEAIDLTAEMAAVDGLIQTIAKMIGCIALHMTPADLAEQSGPTWDAATVQAGEDDPRTAEQKSFDEFSREVLSAEPPAGSPGTKGS